MTIEMYNNVPASKDTSIVLDQYSISIIEVSTKHLLRLGYMENNINPSMLGVSLFDLFEALGYYKPMRQINNFDSSGVIPIAHCRIRTLKNGVRQMRCLPIDMLEGFLHNVALRSASVAAKDNAQGMLRNLTVTMYAIYAQHEKAYDALAKKLGAEYKANQLKEISHNKAVELFKTMPIYKLTEKEVKMRKRRLNKRIVS